MPNNVKKYKKGIYANYVAWCALPSGLKGQPTGMAKRLGISDITTQELLTLADQRSFARHFNVNEATLSRWNRELRSDGTVEEVLSWAKLLTPNVVFALYRRALATGKAKEFRAWMEFIEGEKPTKGGLTLS